MLAEAHPMRVRHVMMHGFYAIIAYDEAGNRWILNHKWPRKDHPGQKATLTKIRETMNINPAHWHKKRKGEW